MTMADPHNTTDPEIALEAFFAAGRSAAAEPSATFLARVLAEAEAVQAERDAPIAEPPAPQQGLWAGIIAALGGWGGAGGLATATMAGVWLGFAGVQGSGTLTAFLAAPEEAAVTLELIPEFDSFVLAALETEG
ncbi:dihydroorotate dehydrogenase [Frigidibacter sp.]|uniref:dihydroorotate dehydrogenase n=1 Tax=Frigidibacter sp. TaxID=2586418 RepID=UPI002732D848|nr:dihydroorotate dehydrogenase [Frigidibacter sp.]MDP3342740.1 dihydroorotate dehydrogenase [Frigidibacter sp.]